jgi:hypothetical protein
MLPEYKKICADNFYLLSQNWGIVDVEPKHRSQEDKPFNAGIKSLRATLPDDIFYRGFCFFNRALR